MIKKFEQFLAPKEPLQYPVVFAILTDGIEERVKGPIALFNHGYLILCETEEELNECIIKFKKGNTYKNETIIGTDYVSEKKYNSM